MRYHSKGAAWSLPCILEEKCRDALGHQHSLCSAQQPHHLKTIKSIDKGEAPGWWLIRGPNSRPGGGSGGISPVHSVPRPLPPGVGGSKSHHQGVVTWTLCVSWQEFPPRHCFVGSFLGPGQSRLPRFFACLVPGKLASAGRWWGGQGPQVPLQPCSELNSNP